MDNYVPFSELEPPDQVASLVQQQKDLKAQHVVQIKTLCEKVADERRRFQCIFNGVGDADGATDREYLEVSLIQKLWIHLMLW